MWDQFIVLAKLSGHTVICVTMRYDNREGDIVHKNLDNKVSSIYFTGRKAKQEFLLEQNIIPNVWIDDNPKWILFNA